MNTKYLLIFIFIKYVMCVVLCDYVVNLMLLCCFKYMFLYVKKLFCLCGGGVFLYKFSKIYLFERFSFTISPSKCPQQPVLGQVESGSLELSSSFPCGLQGSKCIWAINWDIPVWNRCSSNTLTTGLNTNHR